LRRSQLDRYAFEVAALASKLDASQFGSPAILEANQFDSGLELADKENRIIEHGFHERAY
jgi:hypothetical protein